MEIKDIKLKKTRTCNHCPAHFRSMTGHQFCTLGYKVEEEKSNRCWIKWTEYEDLYITIKPAEPCPRPKNIKECVEIRSTGLDVHRYGNPNSPEYKAEFGNQQYEKNIH